MAAFKGLRSLRACTGAVLADRSGVTAAEYAILSVGVAIVVGSAVLAYDVYSPMQRAGQMLQDEIRVLQIELGGR